MESESKGRFFSYSSLSIEGMEVDPQGWGIAQGQGRWKVKIAFFRYLLSSALNWVLLKFSSTPFDILGAEADGLPRGIRKQGTFFFHILHFQSKAWKSTPKVEVLLKVRLTERSNWGGVSKKVLY